ncbi:tetratricopeptide repeat protein [Variovorax sp. IB41]|uniref:tetratricopeptide repeat protein n=1 Tax=Variovorax sp. IB41 TaxID=2779370 RepID=UPI0018E72ACD|nr:tetratricopeptide repeat protein [Variovorax sp. IB41]MBJ2158107.1 tetratricopeptide repeat protein [Variovorax sp. IB41]
MLQRLFAALTFALAALAFAMPSPTLAKTGAQAKEPTIQQIYDAADKGRMDAANAMIAKVLKSHPESAKAHFVHAQLLAMQDELDDAIDALARAKELSPGLKFAKAESVTKLERKLEKPAEIAPPEPLPAPSPVAAPAPVVKDSFPPTGSIPWGPIGIVALIVVAYVFFQRRSRAVTFPVPGAVAEAPRFSRPTSDSSMGYGDREFPPSPPPSHGSNIGGALAAGAVAGVGAVIVGEVLREAMNGRREPRAGSTVNIFNNSRSNNAHIGSSLWPSSDSISDSDSEPERRPDRSFVDNDFGIKDTSSWDDSSSSSSSSDSGGSSDSSSSDSSSSDSSSSDSSSSDSSSSSSDW